MGERAQAQHRDVSLAGLELGEEAFRHAGGGSLVTDAATYDLVLNRCRCVWLKTSPQEHMSRVIAQGDMRPFKGRSAALDEIRKLLEDREPLYARAGFAIDTSGKTVRQSLTELRKALA